jgi:hypothetical protein
VRNLSISYEFIHIYLTWTSSYAHQLAVTASLQGENGSNVVHGTHLLVILGYDAGSLGA